MHWSSAVFFFLFVYKENKYFYKNNELNKNVPQNVHFVGCFKIICVHFYETNK